MRRDVGVKTGETRGGHVAMTLTLAARFASFAAFLPLAVRCGSLSIVGAVLDRLLDDVVIRFQRRQGPSPAIA
jgi:hypothetical protein